MATKRFVSKDNLSRVWTRLFGKVLNSKEEIEANTSENMIAGADAVKEVYSSLADGKIKFGIDADGNYGYIKDGADSVTPFKNGSNIIYIGSGGSTDYRTSTLTFNVSSILPNYKDLTADNFFVNITNLRVSAYNPSGDGDGSSKSASVSTVPSYNPSTGVLTVRVYVGVSSNKANGGAYIGSCKVYYIDNKLPVS